MNDYWNDPPEPPELPECCDEIMDCDAQGVCTCAKCGKRIEPQPDIEIPEPAEPVTNDDQMVNFPPKCPHGNEWFACDACEHASDIAYDTSRERA